MDDLVGQLLIHLEETRKRQQVRDLMVLAALLVIVAAQLGVSLRVPGAMEAGPNTARLTLHESGAVVCDGPVHTCAGLLE